MQRNAAPVLLASLLVLASCSAVQPRASAGPDQGSVPTVGGSLHPPRPTPAVEPGLDPSPAFDRICRTRSMPRGWIAIAYVFGGDECPPSRDPEDLYTAATIQRYADRSVGTVMRVCADQPVPRGWVREYGRDPGGDCPGARVSADQPTSVIIRRVN